MKKSESTVKEVTRLPGQEIRVTDKGAPKIKEVAQGAGQEIHIIEVRKGVIDVCILGSTPIICQAMSAKAKMQILAPAAKKNAAEKASSLKHDPLQEFRDSPYKLADPLQPTYIALPATAFKGALRNAALDLPGASKSQIGRLTYVQGDMINIYGVPQMMMAVVRGVMATAEWETAAAELEALEKT